MQEVEIISHIQPTPAFIMADQNDLSTNRPEVGTSNASNRADDGSNNLGFSVSQFVWMYVCPVILLVGVVGNCLTIAVMRRKRLRGGTVSIYLILMAIADTCFLVVGIIPEWLEALDIVVFKRIHPATCKLEKFIGYTSGDTAIWLLVVFTFDRFVAVCFPLRKSEVCTTTRAKILGTSCLLFSVAKNFHVFWTRGAQYNEYTGKWNNCGRPTKGYEYFESFIRPWIAFALVSAIPFFLICTFNIGIVKTLLCMPTAQVSPSSGPNRAERKYSQTTLMCISVSILFLVTITPSMIIIIGRPYWDSDKENPNYMYKTAKGINNALVFMNHSLNFFLYCLTGRRFREQLVLMFRSCTCCCRIDDGFPNSAAQKASLYLKTIHKFSQEFISTGQRTDETTAGTSVSTGLTNKTVLSRQSTKSANMKIKPDKSKESIKSLDSESLMSGVSIDGVATEMREEAEMKGLVGVSTMVIGGTDGQRSSTRTIIRPPTPGPRGETHKHKISHNLTGHNNPFTLPTQSGTNSSRENYTGSYNTGSTYSPISPNSPSSPPLRPASTKMETRCSVYLEDDQDQEVTCATGEHGQEKGESHDPARSRDPLPYNGRDQGKVAARVVVDVTHRAPLSATNPLQAPLSTTNPLQAPLSATNPLQAPLSDTNPPQVPLSATNPLAPLSVVTSPSGDDLAATQTVATDNSGQTQDSAPTSSYINVKDTPGISSRNPHIDRANSVTSSTTQNEECLQDTCRVLQSEQGGTAST